ncbi:kinesin-like protein KIF2A [Babylonia areolata]|uniref:kinesin-like protein KIF2A n=1 Tax=Babylonia areolata TaxID=304850 RepID=UPI003FCF72C7
MADIASLQVGVNVDIQRTDGRIHSAVISGVNQETLSVTVEWFEKGETKGKEIDLDAVYALNPNVFNHKDGSSNADTGERRVCKAGEMANGGGCVIDDEDAVSVADSCSEGKKSVPPTRARSTSGSARASAGRQIPQPTKRKAVGAKSSKSENNGRVSNKVSTSRTRPSYVRQPVREQNRQPEPSQPPDPKKPVIPSVPGGRRKSNVVKEIEKIKQKRDERRAVQQALREQYESQYDTSDPNWEFKAMIQEFRSTLEFRPMTSSDPIENHQICVCVRKRPMNRKEKDRGEPDVLTVPNKENMMVHEPKLKVDLTKYLENQMFRFDYAFDENSSNEMVYRYTAKPLVESIFEGGMATCFAYGQTGSGKTHTMGGDFSTKGQQDCAKGIYCLAAKDVFRLLNSKYKKLDLVVGASFFEIYSGKVFDLLNNKVRLRVLEDHNQQVQVVGLREEPVTSVDDVLQLIQHGNNVRTSGQTSANQHSSRSHAVFQLILRYRTRPELHGKFSLIDLAGNERGVDTSSADRQTRMEGAEINKSLLALKECIRALGRNGAYLPFRASKLTQVLRDSFIGDKSRTCMIAMVSPGMNCCEHTLNTLRYADRVKELGPGGLSDDRPSDELPPSNNMPEGLMSPQNSDLALIKTTNEEEVSEELLTFHQKMNKMQEMEEDVQDHHKAFIEQTQKWLLEDQKLLKATESVDYDVEAYAKRLDTLLAQRIQALKSLKESVSGELAPVLTIIDTTSLRQSTVTPVFKKGEHHEPTAVLYRRNLA